MRKLDHSFIILLFSVITFVNGLSIRPDIGSWADNAIEDITPYQDEPNGGVLARLL